MNKNYFMPRNPNSISEYDKISSQKDVLNYIELTHKTKMHAYDNVKNDVEKTDLRS